MIVKKPTSKESNIEWRSPLPYSFLIFISYCYSILHHSYRNHFRSQFLVKRHSWEIRYPLFLSSRGLDKLSLVTFPPLVALVKFVPVVGPQLMQAFPPIVPFWADADSTVAKTIVKIIAATNGKINICFHQKINQTWNDI